jgi:hypothetical protein
MFWIDNKKTDDEEKEKKFLNRLSIGAIGVLFFAVISPLVFTQCDALGISPSNITDVYSGVNIMTPFIAIATVIVTFLAFYAQYKANVKLKEDAERQKKDLKRQQLERQFYEMLKIHKDNVNEIKWENWGMISSVTRNNPQSYKDFHSPSQYGYRTHQGRNVFNCFLAEFNLIYNLLATGYGIYIKCCRKRHLIYAVFDENENFNLAYNIFFWGKDVLSNKIRKTSRHSANYRILRIQRYCINQFSSMVSMSGVLQDSTTLKDYDLLYGSSIMRGHFYELNHYYRHLYQMVKYVANYREDIISYEEKRKYLRMLRAQLTNNEQLLLFYNWKSGYGKDWECLNGNHFFTDYRMIHNIDYHETFYYTLKRNAIASKILVSMLKKCNNSIRSEKDENGNERTDDYLFEFEN